MPRQFITLPPLYYRDHFIEMIGFIRSVYGAMLDAEERAFITRFEALDEWAPAERVRRGTWFRGRVARIGRVGGIGHAGSLPGRPGYGVPYSSK